MARADTFRTIVTTTVVALLVCGLLAAAPQAQAARPGTLTGASCIGDLDGGATVDSGLCATGYEHLGGTGVPVVNTAGTIVYVSNYSESTVVWLSRSADGSLTPLGCIADAPAPMGCAEAQGLGAAWQMALSPDGHQLYVVGYEDDAVVRLDVATDGSLSDGGCISDPSGPCDVTTVGLDKAYDIVMAPDGKDLYVGSWAGDGAVVQLRRSSAGVLTVASCLRQVADEDCVAATGVRQVSAVAISPDGRSVYATDYNDGAVAMLRRTPSTGTLTSQGCLSDAEVVTIPSLGCTVHPPAIAGAQSIAVSGDGSSVYVAANTDASITSLRRATDGKLTDGGCIQDIDAMTPVDSGCAASAEGLNQVSAVEVAPDDDQVLTGSVGDNAVATFNRQATGSLAPGSCIQDVDESAASCATKTEGLNGSYALGLSTNGRSVYVGGYSDNALVILDRQLSSPVASITAAKRQKLAALAAVLRSDARSTTKVTGSAVATYRVKKRVKHATFPLVTASFALLPDRSVTKRLEFKRAGALRKLLAAGAKVTVKLTATTTNGGGISVRTATVQLR